MPRNKSILLRLTEEELARLKELAGLEPVSHYLRRTAGLDEPPRHPDALPPMPSPLLVQAGLVPPFRCPVFPACDFRAASDKARCPTHGRQVVLR